MLYKIGVTSVNDRLQMKINEELQNQCITGDEQNWICHTCKNALLKNKIPCQAECNLLEVDDCPEAIRDLAPLEARLIAQRYPFMKLLALPRGKQNAIKGSMVNVPVNVTAVTSALPKTPAQAAIIPLKLKRKLEYKSHVTFQNIRPRKVLEGFAWLKDNNHLYKDIDKNQNWEEEAQQEDAYLWDKLTRKPNDAEENISTDSNANIDLDVKSDISSSDCNDENDVCRGSTLRGVSFDTCVQSVDPVLSAGDVVSIAPGENQTPIHYMLDEHCEELAFPQLFPKGRYGFQIKRQTPLSVKKYFISRLMNKDPRFANNIEYLFFAQYICEHKQIMDCISIAMRKSKMGGQHLSNKVTASLLQNPEYVRNILQSDQAYQFLKPIRGTPPYWQKVLYKLLAAVKQLGIFTWFLTLSAADLHWPDTLQAIARQRGYTLSEDELSKMTWNEKTSVLSQNPVTASRHFDHRLQCFFKDLLLSKSHPLGKITNYLYRIEFQQRGSPHAHCVLWVENAPKLAANPSEDVSKFIDLYIASAVPDKQLQPHLHDLVTTLQTHTHSSSCRKTGRKCRFNFPRPPSSHTIVAKPVSSAEDVSLSSKDALKQVRDVLENNDGQFKTLGDVLKEAGLSESAYEDALKISSTGTKVILQRKLEGVFINNYNPVLLNAWQANMDVQYVADAYACINYVASYVTKDEHEVAEVLKAVAKEMNDRNIRDQMKKCASAFLNSREVSAQEATYRVLGLPLYNSNIETVFIPASMPQNRVSLLKPQHLLDQLEPDSDEVFQTSIIDQYAARPDTLEDMCLTEFAQWYTNAGSYDTVEKDSNVSGILPNMSTLTNKHIQLANKLGKMRKRKKAAVVRYPVFLETKDPESYAYSHLLLFLRWRKEETDILRSYPSYQAHCSELKETLMSKKKYLEQHDEIIQACLEDMAENGPPSHAWDEVAPQNIQESEDLSTEGSTPHPDHQILDPELYGHSMKSVAPPNSLPRALAIEGRPDLLDDETYRALIRSLTNEQRIICDEIFHWCQQQVKSKRTGNIPEPFWLFITGGAGTGKSHLITALHQMAERTIQCEGESPDEIKILLTAPTGCAAYNIGAITLHAAFLLPINRGKAYVRLSEDKRSTLRVKLANLKLLIIDEISMVGADIFLEVHRRLCEIKGNNQQFGGVSVIAVGDMYQLAPIGQQFVFGSPKDTLAHLHCPLWHDHFRIAQLTTIIRQGGDAVFANILNRVRTGNHTDEDVEVLSQRSLLPDSPQYPKEALHVFARNETVNKHNMKMLISLGRQIRHIRASDKYPSVLDNFKPPDNPRHTGGLANELQVASNARVMLTCNVDVKDGLVNGTQGTIVAFVDRLELKKDSSTPPLAIMINFDDEKTGAKARSDSRYTTQKYPNAVPLEPVEVKFKTFKGKKGIDVVRKPYPLRLSWASTVHKVQGLTFDQLVVSFEDPYYNGQAYVALSRVRSLSGLFLSKFDQKKIKVSKAVDKEMTRLSSDMTFYPDHSLLSNNLNISTGVLRIALLNVRSLQCHHVDLTKDCTLCHLDIICLTETFIKRNQLCERYKILDFEFVHKSRPGPKDRGGVGVYVRNKYQAKENVCFVSDQLEYLCITILHMTIVVIYRPPSQKLSQFQHQMEQLMKAIKVSCLDTPLLIVGDFNFDFMSDGHISLRKCLNSCGLQQIVMEPTHISGSCLDHVYVKNIEPFLLNVVDCYYSDHDFVILNIPSSDQ